MIGDETMKYKHLFWLVILVVFSFSSLYSLPFVQASESITLDPIADKCVSNIGAGEEDLTVRYEDGLKWLSFLAFNLSEIPSNASIDSAMLKVKTYFVFDSAYVSAYCSSNADWVETGMSWDTKPVVDDYSGAEWISTHEEWYTWDSWYLKDAVSDAFAETGKFTVMLRSGALTDQTGHIIFYPNAKLEITYTTETKSSELTLIPLWAIIAGVLILLGVLIIAVIVVIYFVRKRLNTRKTSGADRARMCAFSKPVKTPTFGGTKQMHANNEVHCK